MRTYVVQPGDTPARIAASDAHAGCPKCSRDLTNGAVNGHKETVTHPNGYRTFKSLRVGEEINLPDKWFNGELDHRPRVYFAALPHHDGVTPSTLGSAAAGVLNDFSTLDDAISSVTKLASMSDADFGAAVEDAGVLLGRSVTDATNSSDPAVAGAAQEAQAGAAWAVQRAVQMATTMSDPAATSEARTEIQNVLLTALDSARTALKTHYEAPPSPGSTPPFVPTPRPAPTPAPPAPAPPSQVAPPAAAQPIALNPPQAKGLSTGAIAGITILAVGAAGGIAYLSLRPLPGRRRRIRESRYEIRARR